MKQKGVLISVMILLIFAVVIALVTLRLRERIRAQMLERDGSILHAAAHFEATRGGPTPLDLVLGMVDLEGVIGVRFFTPAGEPVAVLPGSLRAEPPAPERFDALRATDSMTWLEEAVRLDTLFADPRNELSDELAPVLRVLVNLDEEEAGPLHGYAEFLLDGFPTVRAFRALDRHLFYQSLAAFAVGGGAILAVLVVSFRRMEKKNRELAEANRELTQHVKTAALGAISGHLFHGLKYAVADLETDPEVAGAGRSAGNPPPGAGQRLQEMIQDVVEVIREENHGLVYSLSGEEILDFAAEKLKTAAGGRGVALRMEAEADIAFSNRRGNLIILAIQNVLRNAIEASPPGESVECRFSANGRGAVCVVRDRGPGIPEDRVRYLFEAGYSSKAEGSGIGLSISRQLCRLMGGDLRLSDTGPRGSAFEMSVPYETDGITDP
jgi:signal transduction histidine kinase